MQLLRAEEENGRLRGVEHANMLLQRKLNLVLEQRTSRRADLYEDMALRALDGFN